MGIPVIKKMLRRQRQCEHSQWVHHRVDELQLPERGRDIDGIGDL